MIEIHYDEKRDKSLVKVLIEDILQLKTSVKELSNQHLIILYEYKHNDDVYSPLKMPLCKEYERRILEGND